MATRILTIALLAALAGLGVAAPASGGDPRYDEGKARWQAGDYRGAYDSLMLFRAQPYGRRPEVDYMLGTSACRIPELRTWGKALLEWMPYGYLLSAQGRSLVERERKACVEDAVRPAAAMAPGLPRTDISAGMEAVGKTFYWVDRTVPVNSYPARRTRELDRAELEGRLQPLSSATEPGTRVEENLRRLGIDKLRLARSDHFVIASTSPHTPQQLAGIAKSLEGYLGFLVQKYDVLPTAYYVTVYLVPDVSSLRQLASKLHGLDVSPATIGYAFADDLSVVGVIPREMIGTLFHELFHLLVRSNFGNIPQFLDEGIAGLYEVSSTRCGQVQGEPNWRGKVLEQLWNVRPNLVDLIASEWFAPDLPDRYEDSTGERPSVQKQAAFMAKARYFMLYLQEKGKLPELYKAFRDWKPEEGGLDRKAEAIRIAQAALGKPLAGVDSDFEAWFKELQRTGTLKRPAADCR